jgi:hypothetical protein
MLLQKMQKQHPPALCWWDKIRGILLCSQGLEL